MKTTLVSEPTRSPVDLDTMKNHLNVDHTLDDFYIDNLISSVTDQVENVTNRKLISQTWKVFFDEWPQEDFFTLPFGSLQSVTSVKYKDIDGTENTVSSGDYIVDTDSDPGRVVLGYNQSWPTTDLYPSNPIYIEFVCGYGTDVADVPYGIRAAIMIMVADVYAYRGSVLSGIGQNVVEVPGHVMNFLCSYRLFGVGS